MVILNSLTLSGNTTMIHKYMEFKAIQNIESNSYFFAHTTKYINYFEAVVVIDFISPSINFYGVLSPRLSDFLSFILWLGFMFHNTFALFQCLSFVL